MAHKPTSELVAIAWLKTITGVPASSIGTTLPLDESKVVSGFIQVLTVGGTPDMYVPMRRPVVSVDFWAGPKQWGLANSFAEIVRDECYTDSGRELSIGVGDYEPAYVHSVYPVSEPRRINNDPRDYAHYSMDVQLYWTVPSVIV